MWCDVVWGVVYVGAGLWVCLCRGLGGGMGGQGVGWEVGGRRVGS
jgi:hypothetical protein